MDAGNRGDVNKCGKSTYDRILHGKVMFKCTRKSVKLKTIYFCNVQFEMSLVVSLLIIYKLINFL